MVNFAFLGFLPSHDYPFPPTYNIPIAKMQISMSEVILSKKNVKMLKFLVFISIIASKMCRTLSNSVRAVWYACVCAPK